MKSTILKNTLIITTAMLTISFATSCQNQSTKDKPVETKDTVKTKEVKKDTIAVDKVNNDIARFIAGMPVDSKSELNTLAQTTQWKNYGTKLDSAWSKFNKKTIEKLTAWSEVELADIHKNNKTLFYPFSGPDFLHAYAIFPKVTKMMLFGLEPVGSVPDMKKFTKENMTSYFSALDKSIEDALNLNFFKTKNMKVDMNNANVDGTLPILLLFVARAGNQIAEIKPLEIGADGKIVYIDKFKKCNLNDKYNKGVEITFIDSKDGSKKLLYYFCAEISDGGLGNNKACKTFFQNLDSNVVSYLKSASYLMHKSYFSTIRNTILTKSSAFLQDDSGIGFHYIDSKKFDIQLYGSYTRPIPLFDEMYEQDLRDAYTKSKTVKTLNFKIGYNAKTNLLLARKK
jgi:hypothetical protein